MRHDPFFFYTLLFCFSVQLSLERIEAEIITLGWQSTIEDAFEHEAVLQDRISCSLKLPGESLSFRSLYTEQRSCVDIEDILASTAGIGLYHRQSHSRLLYGPLEEIGLQKRINLPFSRKLPYNYERSATRTELDADASPLKESQFHAAFSNANNASLRAQGAMTIDNMSNSLIEFGLENSPGRSSLIRLETLFRMFSVVEREADTWFSKEVPLPNRDLSCGAFSWFLDSSSVSFAGDLAFSKVDTQGRGAYANLSFGLKKPNSSFNFSLDGASPQYPGTAGEDCGNISRLASKITGINRHNTKMTLELRCESPYFLALPQKYEILSTLDPDISYSVIFFELESIAGQWEHDISEVMYTTDTILGTLDLLIGPLNSDLSFGIVTETQKDKILVYTLKEQMGSLAFSYSWKGFNIHISGGLELKGTEKASWDTSGSVSWTFRFKRFSGTCGARVVVKELGDPLSINLTTRLQRQF